MAPGIQSPGPLSRSENRPHRPSNPYEDLPGGIYVLAPVSPMHGLLHFIDRFRGFPIDKVEVTGREGLYDTRPRTKAECDAARQYAWANGTKICIDDVIHRELSIGTSALSRQLKGDIEAKQLRFATWTGVVRAARFVGGLLHLRRDGPTLERVAKANGE